MINRFSVISLAGGLYGIEEQGISALCEAVCAGIEAGMKKNADPSDSRIIALAAAMLFYRYVIRETAADDGVASFRAGDVAVTLSGGERLKNSLSEIEKAQIAAAPLLNDEKFYFGQVKYHIH
ncbi:MAG: hypothetical protein IKN56_08080 [Clostridia bacterium]|nr:hypothetical protein [Clostridia bacterium]